MRTFTKKDTSKGSCCPMAVGWALIDMHNEMLRQIKASNFTAAPAEEPDDGKKKKAVNPCPECGEELTFEGGCNICKSCGYTKCD